MNPVEPSAPTCYRHPDRETWIRCQRCDRPICPDCMRQASVGFQCPECVKEGARTVRRPRAPYGGRITAVPRVTMGLIVVNVAVWLLVNANGGMNGRLYSLLAIQPKGTCNKGDGFYPNAPQSLCPSLGGHWVHGFEDGGWWQLLTSAFTHVEVLHIGFNMVALYFLGTIVERLLGPVRYLALYLVSALAGSALIMLAADPRSSSVGASGAIFGLMGALVIIGLKLHTDMQQVYFWIALNLVFTFTAGGGISWQAHIGGLIGGALAACVLVYAPRRSRDQLQAAGLAVLAVLAVALSLVGAVTNT